MNSRARLTAAVLLVAGIGSCGGDTSTNLVPGNNLTSARSIALEPTSVVFDAVGATERVLATARDASGTIIDEAGVSWSTTSAAVTLALPTVLAGSGTIAAQVTAVTGPEIIVVAAASGTARVTATSGAATAHFDVIVAPIPAQIEIISGDHQSGIVGAPLPQPLVVRILDRLGNPIAGQTVRFTATSAGGTPSSETAISSADGMATAIWRLGKTVGTQEIAVTAAGANVVARFAATATAGPAAKIVAFAGNNQTAPANATLPIAPSVKVTDEFDNPLAGIGVVFSVVAGNGIITAASATTDANGVATVASWTLGPSAGTNTLRAALAASPSISTTISATATGSPGFSITLRFLSSMTSSQQAAFTTAASKWASIIVGDLEDVPASIPAGQCGTNAPALNETIDDVLIFATITTIDGPGSILGSAGPCFVRSGANGLTVIGEMLFDVADVASLESSGAFASVVIHEMGHVLGIGTFWPQFGLQNPSNVGGPPRDTFFPGANAILGFNAIGGNTYAAGLKVPVENTGEGGTINAHWRESVLRNELMTGFINQGANPLSVLTVRSLQDLGYAVNVGAADPFFLSLALRQTPETGAIPLPGDIRTGPVFTIDRGGRIDRIRK